MPDQDPLAPREFRRLGSYDVPSVPTEETIQRLWSEIREVFGRVEDDAPLIADAQLGHTSSERLDEIAPPPGSQPVLDDLTHSYAGWLAAPGSGRRVQVVVLPPCDDGDIVGTWAAAQGLDILRAPDRSVLTDRPGPGAPDLTGDGVLVLPQLERWFVRDADGLSTMRALLDAIGASERPILVGCESWAWAFLSKSVDAALLMPSAQTFRAFDGARLQAWFAALSEDVRAQGMQFRLAESGDDVFAETKDGKPHDFFVRLAARSLGIPWIAWKMWRAAISDLHPETEEERKKLPDLHDDETFWIAHATEFKLPASNLRSALLSLHALLIHGALPEAILHRVLPQPDAASVVPALIQAGIVLRDGTGERAILRVDSAAYPTVRSALDKAGFPQDRM